MKKSKQNEQVTSNNFAYNYMHLFRNFTSPFHHLLSNSNIITHLDKISFSLKYPKNKKNLINKLNSLSYSSEIFDIEDLLFDELRHNNFKFIYDCPLNKDEKKSSYKKIRKYRFNKSEIYIFYKPKKIFFPIWIEVQDPDKELINSLYNILDSLELKPSMSHVELTTDFSSRIHILNDLQSFFLNHLFVKNHKNSSNIYRNHENGSITYYLGDLRKRQAKAIRIYLIPKNAPPKALRLEIVLKRSFIKKHKLELPLKYINNIDLTKIICFKTLNLNKLARHLIKTDFKEQYKKMDSGKVKRGSLLFRQLQGILEIKYQEKSLIEKVEQIKKKHGKKKYSNFFDDLPDHNKIFYEILENKSFLN